MKKFLSKKIILALLSILVAFAITFVVAPYLNEMKNEAKMVVVFKDDYNKGTMINESMLEKKERGVFGYTDVVYEYEDILGKYLKNDVKKNASVFIQDISNYKISEDEYLNHLGGKNAISITLKSFAKGLSAKLKAKDIVSVVSASDDEMKFESFIPPTLKYVKVLAVTLPTAVDIKDENTIKEGDNSANLMGSQRESEVIPTSITLLVDSRQAIELANLEQNGNIHLILAYRGEKAQDFLKVQDEFNAKLDELEEKEKVEKDEKTDKSKEVIATEPLPLENLEKTENSDVSEVE